MTTEMTRPVTILAERHAQRWFPFLFHHSDGSILLYIQHGYDAHFSPVHRLRSIDGGRTWLEEQENVPRLSWAFSFADNELLEFDTYGIQDPYAPGEFGYYAAWSQPGSAMQVVRRQTARITAPSTRAVRMADFQRESPYPTFPWWPLINELHRKPEVDGSEIFVGGPYLFSGLLDDERLVAVGFALHQEEPGNFTSVFLYESHDRGGNWEEIATVARGAAECNGIPTPEGFNESSLVRLKNGDLYVVMRGGDELFHCRSVDNGTTWSQPEPLRLVDSTFRPRRVWPICRVLTDGSLVLAFGRPGKHLIFDPTGTGTQWQGHIDLQSWELETQEFMGVPSELRLHGDTDACIRYWDSSDYIACIEIAPRELLIAYDVQNFYEHWNANPISGVRALRIKL